MPADTPRNSSAAATCAQTGTSCHHAGRLKARERRRFPSRQLRANGAQPRELVAADGARQQMRVEIAPLARFELVIQKRDDRFVAIGISTHYVSHRIVPLVLGFFASSRRNTVSP